MTISNKVREQMLTVCGSINDDDGLEARIRESKAVRTKDDEHRRQRLCRRVARTLAFVLPESAVESIRELKVLSVAPGRNRSVLRVQLVLPNGLDATTQDVLLNLLKQQEGWLRFEVAAQISRKRVPRLAFEFVPQDAGGSSHHG